MGKTRRKRYQVSANPVRWAFMVADHQAQLEETRIAEILAIAAVEAGTANAHDLKRLAFMARMGQELAKDGIGPEVLPLCDAILRGGFDAATLRDLMDMHDQQREIATPTQYLRAMGRL
jgi:hypothetical protein